MAGVSPALLKGFQILRVGERSKKDKKFASDEFLAAPPGTVIAPRKKGTPPTMNNAIRALAEVATKVAAQPKPPKFDPVSKKKVRGAQEGAVAGGSQFQASLLQQILNDEIGRVLIPQLNAQIMQALGFIAPSLVGITDPEEFRTGLGALFAGEEPQQTDQMGLTGDVASRIGSASLSTIYQALLGRSTFGGSQIREAFKDVPIDFLRDIGFDKFSQIVSGEVPAEWGQQLRGGLSTIRGLGAPAPGGFQPTLAAKQAFPGSSIVSNLINPVSPLSMSATDSPFNTIPTLAARQAGQQRVLSSLGGAFGGGGTGSVGII